MIRETISDSWVKNGRTYIKVLCSCGNSFTTRKDSKTIYCSECKSKIIKQVHTTHGLSKTRLYSIWSGMKSRCYRPETNGYNLYGGKGIEIVHEWFDFIAFYTWAINNGYSDDLTLDRKDSNGNYSPENCRWVNLRQQNINKNKRKNLSSQYLGVSKIKSSGKWLCTIKVKGKSTYLGNFIDELDAAKAYNAFILKNNLDNKINII